MLRYLKLKCSIVLILSITSFNTYGQNHKKEALSKYNQLTSLSIAQLKTQSYSELARVLSLEDFIVYYVKNGKEKGSKKYGQELLDSIYKDSVYTYFVRQATYPIDFIKVATKAINNISLSAIDGNEIRQKFLTQIIPDSDKEKVENKRSNCSFGSNYFDFKYSYDRKNREIAIQYDWKITCDFWKVINKTYHATYSIDTKTFKNEYNSYSGKKH